MKLFALAFGLITKSIQTLFLLLICAVVLFIAYKGSRPMQVSEAPKGMTYFQFMADRFDAAKAVKPARCGAGMIGSLFALGPFYATLYTHVGLHPQGFLAKVTAPDPDLPKLKNGAIWYEVPGIWWNTFEHLSWTMLGKRHQGCNFRPVLVKTSQN